MATPCKNRFHLIVTEVQPAEVKLGSDVTVLCHLSHEINAADMEIRWFKGTDCVCLYMEGQMIAGVGYKGRVELNMEMERRDISLELKEFRESDDGDYLCQVTSGDRTEEKTVRLSLKIHEGTEMLQSEKTTPEQTDKKTMEKSVLMAVFRELKDTKEECKKKDAEIEELKAERLQTVEEPEAENTQQGNMYKPAKELKTSELNQDNPETKTIPLKKQQNIEEVKVFTLFTGNKNALQRTHKNFIATLQNQIPNLREVDTLDESDVTLIICPNASRVGTDIDAALKRFEDNKGSNLAVLVVLHHTFEPEKIVPDSSKSVNRTDILTVDCLFYEDKGLLECQKNSDSTNKVVNWLISQGRKAGAKVGPHQSTVQVQGQEKSHKSKKDKNESLPVQAKRAKIEDDKPKTNGFKVFSILAGNANNCDQKFIDILEKQIRNLRKVCTVDESDIILVFCPIISRAGTDIEAALNKLKRHTDYEQNLYQKPTVLVVLHHTFDPEKIILDSSRSINRTDILTVDCLFYEDTGLLECQKNSHAVDKVVNWLRQQEKKQETSGDSRLKLQCMITFDVQFV
uniref:Ig-like domain-containing protein n=1 Tax=Cyprinus carpio TaxID=7962 RepID=A0A8C1W2C5_CYPCA